VNDTTSAPSTVRFTASRDRPSAQSTHSRTAPTGCCESWCVCLSPGPPPFSTERARARTQRCQLTLQPAQDELELESYSIYGEGPHGANVAAWIAAKRVGQVESLVLASPGYPLECAVFLQWSVSRRGLTERELSLARTESRPLAHRCKKSRRRCRRTRMARGMGREPSPSMLSRRSPSTVWAPTNECVRRGRSSASTFRRGVRLSLFPAPDGCPTAG